MTIKVGIAGWSVPADMRSAGQTAVSHLTQYAARFQCVEINSSFYRPHRAATYERWAASVPPSFRFAAKVPRIITHEHGLIACGKEVASFCDSVAGLAAKLAVLLVQLPPSLEFNRRAAARVFSKLRDAAHARIVCEARHPSWFDAGVDRFFKDTGVTRVFADPRIAGPNLPEAGQPAFSYLRLHGQPRMYYSAYSADCLRDLARQLEPAVSRNEAWCIFDNTAGGAAWPNALKFQEAIPKRAGARRRSAPAKGVSSAGRKRQG